MADQRKAPWVKWQGWQAVGLPCFKEVEVRGLGSSSRPLYLISSSSSFQKFTVRGDEDNVWMYCRQQVQQSTHSLTLHSESWKTTSAKPWVRKDTPTTHTAACSTIYHWQRLACTDNWQNQCLEQCCLTSELVWSAIRPVFNRFKSYLLWAEDIFWLRLKMSNSLFRACLEHNGFRLRTASDWEQLV